MLVEQSPKKKDLLAPDRYSAPIGGGKYDMFTAFCGRLKRNRNIGKDRLILEV